MCKSIAGVLSEADVRSLRTLLFRIAQEESRAKPVKNRIKNLSRRATLIINKAERRKTDSVI